MWLAADASRSAPGGDPVSVPPVAAIVRSVRGLRACGVRDPREGRSASGTIVTGVAAERVPGQFAGVIRDVVTSAQACAADAAVFVYGSVATGQAVAGRSDVDVLSIGLAPDDAARIGRELSDRHAATCRGVEFGAADPDHFAGDHDEAYGNRVFLRHYCAHLAGPDHLRPDHDFPADARAARGFNGDIADHRDRWRAALDRGDDPGRLARRIARKSLLALAGLVSIHDATWTTDRELAAGRWAEIEPGWATGLDTLTDWVDREPTVDPSDVGAMLDQIVDPLVERFSRHIGLWT